VLLIINDHLDVALSIEADGVHLGQDDFPVDEARKLAPDMIIGASTHDREEAKIAVKQGADYYNIGPIYPTDTKAHLSNFLGPEIIQNISSGIDIPFTVMGGIKMKNMLPLLEHGARIIAVVTAVTKAPDIAGNVRKMIRVIREGRR